MPEKYDFRSVEKKWQDYWYSERVFEVTEDKSKPKFYALIEFPYPSGAGLHVGHIRAFSSMEVISRKKRLEGYNVLFPIGYDAFGLPTENYAMATKQHPRKVTDENIAKFSEQLMEVGYSFDWSRVVDTTDPDYYKWTQWIFIQLFKHGLAYKATTSVNFCPKCKVVLANEESQGGICDRCGSEVEQREKDVWFLKIRNYAERLLKNLDKLNYPERIKTEQQNWIGRSEGADVTFTVRFDGGEYPLVVYTTRPDTIFGATFLVVSPEHPLLKDHFDAVLNKAEIEDYQQKARLKKEFDRVQVNKDKTGIKVEGMVAVNPITGAEIPVFTADYVMMDYGTGAIMAVPAHDKRDWDFAKKFSLPIIEVIKSDVDVQAEPYCAKEGSGVMVNSGFLNGLKVKPAIKKMIEENDGFRKEMEKVAREKAQSLKENLEKKAEEINGVKVVTVDMPVDPVMLKNVASMLQKETTNTAVLGAFEYSGKPQLLIMYSADLVAAGHNAARDIKEAAKAITGGGGGQPGLATAGGRDASGLGDALETMLKAATGK